MKRKRPISQDRLASHVSWSGIFISAASLVPVFTQHQTSAPFYAILSIGLLIVAVGLSIRISEFAYGLAASTFYAGLTRICRCNDGHIDQVHEMARRYFGEDVTDVCKIREIQSKFKDGLQVAIKKDEHGNDIVSGYFFLFPINKRCVERIVSFNFDISEINQLDIATKPQYGHAVYIGGIAADGIFIRKELLGAIRVADSLVSKTKTKTVYARAATPLGLKLLQRNGFSPVHPMAVGLNCFYMRVVL